MKEVFAFMAAFPAMAGLYTATKIQTENTNVPWWFVSILMFAASVATMAIGVALP